MACPFVRHSSIAESTSWNIEDDLSDIPDDALTLSHLSSAIQLLTAPSVSCTFLRLLPR